MSQPAPAFEAVFTVSIGADQHDHNLARYIAEQIAKTIEHLGTTSRSGGLSLHHTLVSVEVRRV